MEMSAINLTLEQFRSVMLAAGYDEVTERSWDANTKLDEHTHPFDANAIVVSGNFWLSVNGGETKQLSAGDTFHVVANTPHSEEYGPEGATYWVARKSESKR
jgi:mannose-6-phosphate isomerase-like protein (cupin superfamily)